jgi:hypothetical protein
MHAGSACWLTEACVCRLASGCMSATSLGTYRMTLGSRGDSRETLGHSGKDTDAIETDVRYSW